MIQGTIHKEDRHYKPFDIQQQRNKDTQSKNQRKYKGKKICIIIVRHINICL